MSPAQRGQAMSARLHPTRRTLALGLAAAASSANASALAEPRAPRFAEIERASGGKLGVFALDTGSGRTLAWRADQRFPFCSSFKALLAAFVLFKVDGGELRLDQRLRFTAADVGSMYAPVASRRLSAGAMTVEALCAAAVSYSDNVAANLLLREIGGPAALTAWMRTVGDDSFQLTHNEPALNYSRLGDAQDTTTPQAMAMSFRRLVFGQVLAPSSRARLTAWLVANTTGGRRLRAGLPTTWRVGDKTGTLGSRWNSTIDIAVAWPPRRAPLVIAGFVTDIASTPAAEALLAEVARQTVAWSLAHG